MQPNNKPKVTAYLLSGDILPNGIRVTDYVNHPY